MRDVKRRKQPLDEFERKWAGRSEIAVRVRLHALDYERAELEKRGLVPGPEGPAITELYVGARTAANQTRYEPTVEVEEGGEGGDGEGD